MRPFGLTARPKGPGPVTYSRPRGAMMRPPGSMLGAPGRRIAGRVPAGAPYSAAGNGSTARNTARYRSDVMICYRSIMDRRTFVESIGAASMMSAAAAAPPDRKTRFYLLENYYL